MDATFMDRHPRLSDGLSLVIFVIGVAIGTVLLNAFVFQTFNVEGASMETTMYTGDRLIVNRLPVTMSKLQNKNYTPKRGQIIVFKNPNYNASLGKDEYIVKRVIAFAGERVTVKNGTTTVYNKENPNGFNPDSTVNKNEPGQPTSGNVDTVVPKGTIFVMGDHRQGNYSCDSRNCMGSIPLYDIVGPVSLRIFPFTKIRGF
jgi:signal peptidase I